MMTTKEYREMMEITHSGITRAKETNNREDYDYWKGSEEYWAGALRDSIQRDREKHDEVQN